MFNENNDDNTGHNGSNKGKFSERLAKIRRDKIGNRKNNPLKTCRQTNL